MTNCTCYNCTNSREVIEHKKSFTPAQLGLKGGRQAKAAYISRLRAAHAASCERVDWMDAALEFTEQAGGRATIMTEISALSWHPLPCSDVPFMQGYALGHLIKEVVKGKVHRIAWDGILCNRYDLIGIEAEYSNGTFLHYWADTGTGLIPLCSVRQN